MLAILLTLVHVIVCLFLIVVVLLQSGKAADLTAAFGGQGSQTVFGPRGAATVLSKATTIAAGLFMVTSLTLSIVATRAGKATPSILDKVTKPAATKSAPATPSQQAPAGGTAPITVTPEVGGEKQAPQQVQVPVLTPEQVQQKNQQQQKK
jgi:preprotein translocase subunit SecG